MPFTLAHPAAAIPLARTPLVFSALVAGSLAPDFAYVLGSTRLGLSSHTIPGLFWFCLPVGLLALWLWHALLKRALMQLLPACHYRKLLPASRAFRFGTAAQRALIVLSVLVGAATHVAWDAFTHEHGAAVQFLPALQATLLQTRVGPLKLFKVLQHGSTVFGLALLMIAYARWSARAPVIDPDASPALSPRARGIVVTALAGSATLIAISTAWITSPPYESFNAFCVFVVRSGIVGTSILAIGAMGFSLWWVLSGRGTSASVC